MYWIHDGKVLKDTDRIRISQDELRIHIKNTQSSDHGIYQCFASNSRDQAYGIYEFNSSGKFLNIFTYTKFLYSYEDSYSVDY